MLRPVDMNLSIQHAADAARAATNQAAARPEVAQQQFTDRLEKQMKQQEKQVQGTNQAESNHVNPDAKGNSGGYQPKKKKPGAKPDPKRPMQRPNSESIYDFRA